MDFWDLRDEDQYEHVECAAKEFGKVIAEILRKAFESPKLICPCCKSDSIETDKSPHVFCLDCGQVFESLKK